MEFPELAPQLADTFPLKINPTDSSSGTPPPSQGTTKVSLQNKIESHSLSETKPRDEVAQFSGSEAGYRILEIGCGVGNTIFPVLETNDSSDLFVYGGDFSSTAIDIIKKNPNYDTNR